MNEIAKRVGGLIAIVAAIALPACSGDGDEQVAVPPAPAPVLSDAEATRAQEIFLDESCEVCHGEQAEGMEDVGPALVGLAPYWNEERLMVYLEDPTAFREANPDFDGRRQTVYDIEMPSFEHTSSEDRRLLARWLLTR